MLSVASAKKLRVPELRAELLSRGLNADGVKAVLLKRLLSVLNDSTADDAADDAADAAASNDIPKAAETAAAVSDLAPIAAAPVIPLAPALPAAVDTAAATEAHGQGADPPQQEQQQAPNADKAEVSELERMRKRAQRFGTPLPTTPAPKKTDQALGKKGKKRGIDTNDDLAVAPVDKALSDSGKKRGRTKVPPVLDLNDPAVQKRIDKFGPPTGDSDFAVAYRAAEAKLALSKRKERFGEAQEESNSKSLSTPDNALMAARKMKFGLPA